MIEVLIIEDKNKTGVFMEGMLVSVFRQQTSSDVRNWINANLNNVKITTRGGSFYAPEKHATTFR